jgi:hypothetical protein
MALCGLVGAYQRLREHTASIFWVEGLPGLKWNITLYIYAQTTKCLKFIKLLIQTLSNTGNGIKYLYIKDERDDDVSFISSHKFF